MTTGPGPGSGARPPVRVMLVDDAVVVRHVLAEALAQHSDLTIVGTAADGMQAMEKIAEFAPDVVVLDVEMPRMDGIETLIEIKRHHPRVRVVMFSTLTSRGAAATMDALMAGADDYVTKPSQAGSMVGAVEHINAELVPRIRALAARSAPSSAPAPTRPPPINPAFTVRPVVKPSPAPALAAPARPYTPVATARPPVSPGAAAPTATPGSSRTARPQVLAIAVSTGGPNALALLLPQLPANLAVPIVIVQHIPPMFSKALADRLDGRCPLAVAEGEADAVVQPGQVWIAPGDFHMVVRRSGPTVRLGLNQEPPENSCRPAADVLFRSVAATYGGAVLGLVLTGMGSDGLKGSQQIVASGGRILAQDEASSVVWGMPGAVVDAGVAERVLPLESLAAEIVNRVGIAAAPAGIPTQRS